MKIICTGCNKPTNAPALNPPIKLNYAAVSMVIVEHPEQFACENCGAVLVVGIANVNVALAGVVLPKQAQKPVIIAPGSLN